MSPEQMEKRLKDQYPNSLVAVIDLTGTSDHFEVRIKADELGSLTRIQRHKAIMDVFQAELATGEVHALTIKTL